MGATSVSGVSGPGSAAGNTKGSSNMSLGVNKLIGPRVVAAGVSTLSGTTLTVDFPTLPGVAADYIAIATDTNATATAVNVTSLTTSTIALKGGSGHVINWVVIKVGY